MEKLKKLISTYEDHPRKGINFKDVLEITQHPQAFKDLVFKMASSEIIKNADAIISIDARGFVFGSAIAFHSNKPMLFARKPGKLPGNLIEKQYTLEYGKNSLSLQKDFLKKYSYFAIVDDLLATGGTAKCVSKLVKDCSKKISGLVVVVELEELFGRKNLKFPVESVLKY
tara:strand:- start:56 stop:568 length:513 start_codon:yes stop_codon:yes gene_type:complete